jgi:hypothetical protein
MGGGGTHYNTPKYVWSPSGGWWANPANWKKSTGIAFGVIGLAFAGLCMVSSGKEVRAKNDETGI